MPLTVRQRQPSYLQQGIAQVLALEVEQNGQPIGVPSALTYTLIDSDGVVVTGLDAATATPAAGGGTYSMSNTALDAVALGDSYTEQWGVTLAGQVYTVRRLAIVCLVAPLCPFTVTDLVAALPEIADADLKPTGWATLQDPIDEAWSEVQGRLAEYGQPVHKTVAWDRYRRVVKRTAVMAIAEALAMTRQGPSRWAELADILGGTADDPRSLEAAWLKAVTRLDRDDDGAPDTDADSEIRPGVYGGQVAVTSDPEAAGVVGRFF